MSPRGPRFHASRERLLRCHAVSYDVSAIRPPFRASSEAAACGNFFEPRAVGVNDVDICQLKALPTTMGKRRIMIAAGGERDPLAVGRPRRPEVTALF